MTRRRRDPDLVRSYVRTGGRVRPTRQLDLVTLVRARTEPTPGLGADTRRMLLLCSRRGALSLVELAAYLDLPPSVVKILAADLLDSGHLITPAPEQVQPELALLEEVLDGLRALAG